MFLKQRNEGHLVEISDVRELINPLHKDVTGRLHYGEEMQDPEKYNKSDLVFPSGESLPQCWTASANH
jgi:hypothetical protein